MQSIRWFFPILILSLGSCKKWATKQEYTLDPGFRSYFNYKNGSEWNYIEINDTTKKETVTVTGFMDGKMVWDALEQEFLQYDLISTRDSSYKIRLIADANNVGRAAILVKDTLYKQAAEWYYVGGNFAGTVGSGDTFIFHSNYTQAGKSYTDVIEFKPKKDNYFQRIWLASKVGIIRKELKSGEVYILKSYLVQ